MTMSNDVARTVEAGATVPRRTSLRSSFVHALQGLMMGTADVIPGVSGGTVALIVGIYERLIDTIHHVAAGAVSLVRRDPAAARADWRRAEFGLVLPLGVGIVVALGVGSVVLPPLIEAYPVITSSVFFGLIAAALPFPWRRIGVTRRRHYALAVAGAAVAFVLAGLAPVTVTDPTLLMVFAAAAVAICAMILPGVSGAYLLLVMGMYEVTLHAVSALDAAYVAVFAAGAVTGLGVFSKLLSWLLAARHDATMAVLVGLMAGSLRRLWPWHDEAGTLFAPPDGGEAVLALACMLLGLGVVTALTVVGDRRSGAASGARHGDDVTAAEQA